MSFGRKLIAGWVSWCVAAVVVMGLVGLFYVEGCFIGVGSIYGEHKWTAWPPLGSRCTWTQDQIEYAQSISNRHDNQTASESSLLFTVAAPAVLVSLGFLLRVTIKARRPRDRMLGQETASSIS